MGLLIGLHGVAEDEKGNRIGSARVGKDEIGEYLEHKGFNRQAFSQPLYKTLEHVYSINPYTLNNLTAQVKEHHKLAVWDKTIRELLQSCGDMYRAIDKDFFIKHMKLRIGDGNTVITDVRFNNEARFIREQGGVIVHVHRKTYEGKVAEHTSEKGIKVEDSDLHLYNYGTIKELYDNIYNLVTEIKGKK